jgi:hypothetical protein
MIRVTKTEEPSRTLLTTDGQLLADSIAVVETCCNQAESARKHVQLFFRDVTPVDQTGRMLLARLAAKSIRLVASGVYTSCRPNKAEPSRRLRVRWLRKPRRQHHKRNASRLAVVSAGRMGQRPGTA